MRINETFENKIDGNDFIRRVTYIILFILISVMMFKLNRPTPWVVDDLLKSQAAMNMQGLNDMFQHGKNFYLHWGGRVWGEIFAQAFLMIPKNIFDIINTIGYMILLVLMQWNILEKWKFDPVILVFIHFSLLLCLPVFGQDILWISGSANYMWASLLPLLFLGIWRSYQVNLDEKINHPISICFVFVLGIFAGWSNENVSVGLVAIVAGYMYIYRSKLKKIPSFAYAGGIGLVLGSLVLWLAPGNFVRFAFEKHSHSPFHIANMVLKNIWALFDPAATLFLVILFVILLVGSIKIKKETAIIIFLGAVISSIAFSVIGRIDHRVFFGPVMLMIIASGILYEQWNQTLEIRKIKFLIMCILFLGCITFYSDAKNGINDYAAQWNDNQKIIKIEKDKGNLDVYVNPIFPKNKFCATYGLDDIKPKNQNKHWLNTGVAKYFGLRTIQSVRVENK